MFIPIGDEPNPRKFPLVNYVLIAANVAVFLFVSLPLMAQPVDRLDPAFAGYLRYLTVRAPDVPGFQLIDQISAYELFTWKHGFQAGAPHLGNLLLSMFLHGGWLHLIGNMLFLWIYGDNVEHRLGTVRYVLVYLGTGIAATLFFAVFQHDSMTPLIGASGAISGVLGAYFWWFPKNRVKFLVVLLVFVDVWRLPARWVLGFYLIWENVVPFLADVSGGGGVAHGAHIGGFLAGLAVAMVLGRGEASAEETPTPPPRGAWVLDRSGRPIAEVEPGDGFRAALRRGDVLGAADAYAHMSPAQRLVESDGEVLSLAQGLEQQGRTEAALAVLQGFMAQRPRSPSLAEAHYLAAGVHLRHTGRLLAAREHLLAVLDLHPAAELESWTRDALAAVEDAVRKRRDLEPG
jgi:membrane associated rhomboid family serine protease